MGTLVGENHLVHLLATGTAIAFLVFWLGLWVIHVLAILYG